MGRFLPSLVISELGPSQNELAVRAKLLHGHFSILFKDVGPSHIDFVCSHENPFIFKNCETYQNAHQFVDLNSFNFLVHKKEVIEEVSELFETLISLPDIALENNEGVNIDWDRCIGYWLNAFVGFQAQFDHI